MNTTKSAPWGAVVYPRPDRVKESRFGYSTQCLTLATLAAGGSGVAYFPEDLAPAGVDGIVRAVAETMRPVVAVFLDSIPLHRSSNVRNGRDTLAALRERLPMCRLIACGPYCMTTRSHEPLADLTLVDEPESAFLEAWNGGTPPGSLAAGDARGVPVRLLGDLGSLPAPDRGLLPPGTEVRHGDHGFARAAVVSTSRGCTGRCTFCPRRAWTLGHLRHRGLGSVVEEVGTLIERGYRNLWIDDDNMAADPDRSIALFEEIHRVNPGRRCGLYISSWPRPNAPLLAAAARAGVRVVSFGIESGSEVVLRSYRKPLPVASMRQAIEIADGLGLFTVANVIVGAPCERAEDIELTAEFLRSAPVDSLNVKVLSYIRGADLWAEAVGDGRLSPDDEWVLADRAAGTGSLPRAELVEVQRGILAGFEADPRHRARLSDKVRTLGAPYRLPGPHPGHGRQE